MWGAVEGKEAGRGMLPGIENVYSLCVSWVFPDNSNVAVGFFLFYFIFLWQNRMHKGQQ